MSQKVMKYQLVFFLLTVSAIASFTSCPKQTAWFGTAIDNSADETVVSYYENDYIAQLVQIRYCIEGYSGVVNEWFNGFQATFYLGSTGSWNT